MGFFKSFWRETGRNTGKWVSNKVFGDGWSTPHRIKHSSDDSVRPVPPKRDYLSNNTQNRNNINDGSDESSGRSSAQRDEQQRLNEVLANTDFNATDAHQISIQLDDLITAASQATASGISVSSFKTKIRSGIIRLHRLNETELAVHYENELSRITRKSLLRSIGIFIFTLIVFGMLIIIAKGKI